MTNNFQMLSCTRKNNTWIYDLELEVSNNDFTNFNFQITTFNFIF